MARRRETSSKPSGKSQASALESARDVVVKLRGEGLSLQEITDRLAVQGVRVNRNAVDRFCKKYGIVAGIAKAAPEPKAVEPEPPKYESFPKVIVPKPKRSFPQLRSAPATRVRPKAAESLKSVESKPSIRAPEPEREAVHAPTVLIDPSAASTDPPPPSHAPVISVQPDHSVVRIDLGPPSTVAAYSVALPVPESPPASSPARNGVTDDQLAIAKVLAGLGPRIQRIDEAHRAGDFDATADAMREAIAWLDSVSADVPEYVRELARKAIRETEAMLASARRPIPLAPLSLSENPKPLFMPLPPSGMWSPDVAILGFGTKPDTDRWTIQDACEGTLILGATGSGKTTGSGATIARAFLSAQFGGLVLTAKQDESVLWERYAKATDRTGQICRVRPGGSFRFNFLQYQAGLSPENGGSTENIVESLYTLLEGFSRGGGQRGGEHGSFWANTARQLLRNLLRVMKFSRTPLTLSTLRTYLYEAPQSADDARSGAWKQTRFFGPIITMCQQVPGTSAAEQAEREESLRYWLSEFPGLNAKTRSIVVTDFTSMVDLFFDPTLGELFLSDTTITPEAAIHDGAIIVVDLPIEKYQAIGRLAQLVWKHFLQQAVKRRADADGPSRRPVFLWIDEFQSLLSEGDAAFQATARSARCATVLLTQNLPGLYAQAGPTLPRERIDALSGNLATKFLHANSDPTTNQWAAEQIGKSMQYRATVSSPDEPPLHRRGLMDRLLWPARARTSTSPTIDFEVQPSAFTKLRTGSQRYDFTVDAVMVKSGARFSNGKHYLSVSFQQEHSQP